MDHQKERELIDRYLSGNCSAEEREWIDQWYIARSGEVQDELTEPNYELVKTEMLRSIQGRAYAVQRKLWPRIAGIAAAIAVIVSGVWFYTTRHPGASEATRDLYANDIAPGKNTATLTVNGKTINLSDAKSGVIIDATDIKYNDNTPVISNNTPSSRPNGRDLLNSIGKRSLGALEMTLTTPRGGTYQVRLPDGTNVWLNAASSLTYATVLKERGAERVVKLTGEAYFEVAPAYTSLRGRRTKQPFIVESKDQFVEVLGTHFNISSYAYEAGVKTTLLEGSVQVTPLQEPQKKTILKPGEQAIVAKQFLKIVPVDVEVATAWKNGNFLFKEEQLESILNRLAYWYDVQIVYEGKKPVMTISGIIERKRKLSSVLKMIEATGKAKFRIEGRRVFVMN
jgi:ferric-dicitrate binding protein FerR (iron transport regulator)